MNSFILTAIGAAALGYVLYLIWNSVTGKSGCNCSGSCSNAACKAKMK